MILGIGIDCEEIKRVESLCNNTHFIKRFFTDKEILLFSQKNNSPKTITANFCGKEAFSKAIGTGIRGFSLKDIEILRDDFGKPYINLYNSLKHYCEENNIYISFSHTDSIASAFVIIERK